MTTPPPTTPDVDLEPTQDARREQRGLADLLAIGRAGFPQPEDGELSDDAKQQAEWAAEWWGLTPEHRSWLTRRALEEFGWGASATKGAVAVKLPKLTPKTRDKYIAAVTAAMAAGTILAPQGRALLYAAQVSVTDQKQGR